jgi:cysteine sulfinate desulfinase/cysteine desulfurase-like protein
MTPVDPRVVEAAVRFSMGRTTKREQIDYVLSVLPPEVERLWSLSPGYRISRS